MVGKMEDGWMPWEKEKGGKGDGGKGGGKSRADVPCHYCGIKGHFKDKCHKNPYSIHNNGEGKDGKEQGKYGKGYGKDKTPCSIQ